MSIPSRHIHLDPVGGIAGDMFIAAMLDALPEIEPFVLAEIEAVLPPDRARATLIRGKSGGMAVSRFAVEISEKQPIHRAATHHHHTHCPDEYFTSLVKRIEKATISSETQRHALAILTLIAQAESRMHDLPLDEVHFHELADWDSLADVVGAGAIIGALGGTGWSIGPLPLGSGLVKTAHGFLPVPAPATAVLLEGLSVVEDGIGGERVTPTGAAIAAHLHDGLTRAPPASAVMGRQGMGGGTRDLPDRPNVLRALVLETASAEPEALPMAHNEEPHSNVEENIRLAREAS
ncbi:nickel insertion protein [Notoacmeibacter sp. MSK16QG-6]|uniref:nickel insertion protein n=1 Tax=Notoacmeibacter sp. MSK16QG-6 TaxID=2957982 RepID=UPI00209EC4D9|nr:nickel insertion protein [Notoacmeibacter sp. MSK16QG-6]MCP1199566.1 LarC family nickel insertion protein [Notoacmeibacter sp. MSK16QG-6]